MRSTLLVLTACAVVAACDSERVEAPAPVGTLEFVRTPGDTTLYVGQRPLRLALGSLFRRTGSLPVQYGFTVPSDAPVEAALVAGDTLLVTPMGHGGTTLTITAEQGAQRLTTDLRVTSVLHWCEDAPYTPFIQSQPLRYEFHSRIVRKGYQNDLYPDDTDGTLRLDVTYIGCFMGRTIDVAYDEVIEGVNRTRTYDFSTGRYTDVLRPVVTRTPRTLRMTGGRLPALSYNLYNPDGDGKTGGLARYRYAEPTPEIVETTGGNANPTTITWTLRQQRGRGILSWAYDDTSGPIAGAPPGQIVTISVRATRLD